MTQALMYRSQRRSVTSGSNSVNDSQSLCHCKALRCLIFSVLPKKSHSALTTAKMTALGIQPKPCCRSIAHSLPQRNAAHMAKTFESAAADLAVVTCIHISHTQASYGGTSDLFTLEDCTERQSHPSALKLDSPNGAFWSTL